MPHVGVEKPCWQGETSKPNMYTIWNRVMSLSEETQGSGLLCVREGIDVVAECRQNKADLTNVAVTHRSQDWVKWLTTEGLTGLTFHDIKLQDCDVLERYINPYCSFPAPWTKQINAEVKKNGGWTIDFW